MSVFTLRNAIRDSTLERREYVIMMTAASHDDGDGIITISKETLAEESRYCRAEVYEALKALEALGWYRPIKHPHRPRAKALLLTIGRNPEESGNPTSQNVEESENPTTQLSGNPTSLVTRQVTAPELSGYQTRQVRKPDNSPTPPKKEEQTREQTRASQQAARTHEATPAPAEAPPSELLARSLPSVDFPDKPGPPTADFDADLVEECRREWLEAHAAARITRRWAMGSRWVQTHFGPLTPEQRTEIWASFRRRLVDGSLSHPEGWLSKACKGKAQDGAKVLQMPRKRKPPQPSSLSDYSHLGAEAIAILTGQKRGAS